jgi:hypothetical protein
MTRTPKARTPKARTPKATMCIFLRSDPAEQNSELDLLRKKRWVSLRSTDPTNYPRIAACKTGISPDSTICTPIPNSRNAAMRETTLRPDVPSAFASQSAVV